MSTEVEIKPEEVTSVGKKKKSGNLIVDTAQEIENYDRRKALHEADKLKDNVDESYFRLGGVLKLINDNSWYEGYPSFETFVYENYGFKLRKAHYLISIYDNLVTKNIPWEKVSKLGWTKLKELAPILTPENVDEWIYKVDGLSYSDILKLLKAESPEAEPDVDAPVSDGLVKMKFNFKADQAETVQQAIQKAKGELNTEYDTVAFENICYGYLGGNTTVAKIPSLEEMVEEIGFLESMERISAKFPNWDISLMDLTKVNSGTQVAQETPIQ